MKGKELFDELGNVREDFIQDTANSLYGEEERNEDAGEGIHGSQAKGSGKEGRWRWLLCSAAAAAVLLIGTVFAKEQFFEEDKNFTSVAENQKSADLSDETKKEGDEVTEGDETSPKIKKGGALAGQESDVYQVQSVSYPEQADWLNDEKWRPDKGYLKSLKNFYKEVFQGTLISEKQENTACSPVNLYLCMAMLTEMTSGETQSELLEALGQSTVKTVREQSQKIWNAVYEDNDISKCILGNSVWLNQDISYKQDVLKNVSDNYYASTHQGEMGTVQMDEAIQKWVNDMTGDALKEQAEGIETKSDTAAVLLSTAYFYDQWITPFLKENTKSAIFHNADGSQTKCDFMQYIDMGNYICRKKDFTAVPIGFENNQKDMWVFLPNDGVTVDEMIEKGMDDILHILNQTERDEDGEHAEVTIKLPKFQIETDEVDLIPAMRKMGIESLFEAEKADFTSLVGKEKKDEYQIYADKVVQSSKMAVDENGCSVASYTEVELRCGAALPKNKYTVNCNKPFLVVIGNSYNGIPIFAGVVNEIKE